MKILVTGGNGQLGCEINQLSSNYNYDWLFTDTDIFDISDLMNINVFLDKCNPDVIINCAAYTAVDNAEVDFENANIINHKATLEDLKTVTLEVRSLYNNILTKIKTIKPDLLPVNIDDITKTDKITKLLNLLFK